MDTAVRMIHPKRVLVATVPAYGHVFPLVPLAWALRNAGCDVLVATTGWTIGAVRHAGLSTVDVAVDTDLAPIYASIRHAYRPEHPGSFDGPERLGGILPLYAALGEVMTPGTIAIAEQWRADLIVHGAYCAAGPLAAAALDIPSVFVNVGIADTPEFLWQHVYSPVAASVGRPSVARPTLWIDTVPASVRESTPAEGARLPMRYVPFSSACAVGAEWFARSDRPVIAMTIGPTGPQARGFRALRSLIRAAADVNADFLVTFAINPTDGPAPESPVGPLPANVHAIPWVPFDRLFAMCDGVVHHGGSGTVLTSLITGVAQLVAPQGADSHYNAAMLSRRGVAVACMEPTVTTDMLAHFVTMDACRAAAADVRDEMLAMPNANEVAGVVAQVAANTAGVDPV